MPFMLSRIFQRIDATSMKVEEAERLIKIWEGLFGFVSGVYRYAEVVIGRDSEGNSVYGSWHNTSTQSTWAWDLFKRGAN